MKVNESFPFSISLSWKGSGPDAQESGPDNQLSTLVFSKGNVIPSVKALTFYRSGTFSVDVQYADVSELQAPAKISTYTVRLFSSYYFFNSTTHYFYLDFLLAVISLRYMQIGPFQTTKGERAKIKVKVRLNLHGIVFIESATVSVFKGYYDCNYYFFLCCTFYFKVMVENVYTLSFC